MPVDREDNDEKRPESPKVHKTFWGKQYVDANELINSKVGRSGIKRTKRAVQACKECEDQNSPPDTENEVG